MDPQRPSYKPFGATRSTLPPEAPGDRCTAGRPGRLSVSHGQLAKVDPPFCSNILALFPDLVL